MELYYAPLACSLATRIALYEAGAPAAFIAVDTRTKLVADGSDFRAINAMGQVPVLRTDDGELLTENPAVLQYVADRYPESHLAPSGGMPRYRLQQWLNFITSELHKVVFIPLLDPRSGDGAKAFARDKATERLAFLNAQLDRREHTCWTGLPSPMRISSPCSTGHASRVWTSRQFMAVDAYFNRLRERPSIARALAEELVLYQEQQARRAA